MIDQYYFSFKKKKKRLISFICFYLLTDLDKMIRLTYF